MGVNADRTLTFTLPKILIPCTYTSSSAHTLLSSLSLPCLVLSLRTQTNSTMIATCTYLLQGFLTETLSPVIHLQPPIIRLQPAFLSQFIYKTQTTKKVQITKKTFKNLDILNIQRTVIYNLWEH